MGLPPESRAGLGLNLKIVFIRLEFIAPPSMNLAQARIGQVVTVEHVAGDGSFRRRLMELGLVPGTRVEVIGVAPLGDPLELLVRGGSLSIRRAEAQGVAVTLGDETSAKRLPSGHAEAASLAPPGFARSAP